MRILDLIITTKKKRLFFSTIALAIAGASVIFVVFLISSVEKMISSQFPITDNEYYLNINESQFSENNINYYERLKESFDLVVPFIYSTDSISDIEIIGTNLESEKILIDNNVYSLDIVSTHNYSSVLPNVIVSLKTFIENNESNVITLNNSDFNIIKVFSVEDRADVSIVLMPIDIYAQFIDQDVLISNEGLTKYIINFYYIYSSLNDFNTRLTIENIYNFNTDSYIINYDSLLNQGLSDFSIIYQLPILFFILIAVVSFVNMNITIKLLIKDRRKMIKTLYIVGMKFSDLKKIILGEIALVSLFSSIISLLVGICGSIIVLSFIKGLTVTMPRIDYTLYILILLIIVPIIQSYLSLIALRSKSINKLIEM